jgi:hypothetical protein
MIDHTRTTDLRPVRNPAARASLVSAIACLLAAIAILASAVFTDEFPFLMSDPTEISDALLFVWFPVFCLAGLAPLILGIKGYLSARGIPGGVGHFEAIAGTAVAAMALFLNVVSYGAMAVNYLR